TATWIVCGRTRNGPAGATAARCPRGRGRSTDRPCVSRSVPSTGRAPKQARYGADTWMARYSPANARPRRRWRRWVDFPPALAISAIHSTAGVDQFPMSTPDTTSVPTEHSGLRAWVEEVAELTQPAAIHWCDGSG